MDNRAQGLTRDATVSLFQPARNTILLLLGLAAIAAPLSAILAGHTPTVGFVIRCAAMLAAASVLALSQFRDPSLAIAGALAPLPGVSLVFFGTPDASVSPSAACLGALVYALGFSAALIAGESFTARIADGEEPRTSAIQTLRDGARLLAPVLAVGVALPGLLAVAGPLHLPSLLLAGGNALATLSAWLVVPLVGSFLPGSEDFIARTNRARESWTRRLERVALVARPPWSLSVSGILLVLLVLGAFGSTRLVIGKDMMTGWRSDVIAGLVILLAGAGLAARGWRGTLAVLFAEAGAVLFGLWGYARADATLDGALALMTAGLCALVFAPIAAIAASAAFSGRSDAPGASEAGILRAGPAAATGVLATLIVLAPWYREFGTALVGFILAILFAAGGAFAFQPAVAGALEELVPRRQTLAERYRVK